MIQQGEKKRNGMEKLTRGKGKIFSIIFGVLYCIVTNEVILQRNTNYCVLWKTNIFDKPSYHIISLIYIYCARQDGFRKILKKLNRYENGPTKRKSLNKLLE